MYETHAVAKKRLHWFFSLRSKTTYLSNIITALKSSRRTSHSHENPSLDFIPRRLFGFSLRLPSARSSTVQRDSLHAGNGTQEIAPKTRSPECPAALEPCVARRAVV